MFRDKDLSNASVSAKNLDDPDEKIEFHEKGIDFLRDSEMGLDGFHLKKPSKSGVSGSQELTLSYLCDNSKINFPEKEFSGKILMEKLGYKGKEVVESGNLNLEERWVERDFLKLNEICGDSSKREVNEESFLDAREKKPKLETLNLSLALSDVALSIPDSVQNQNLNSNFNNSSSNPLLSSQIAVVLQPSRSTQSLAPSNNNTQTTCSNDFTGASLSYSYSHQFSHNPSCSLTRNSTENYEHSTGSHRRENDQIWYGGEGTNGSVHSRFKPIGDGVSLSNHGGGGLGFSMMNGSRLINKDSSNHNNSLYRTTSSENHSLFPSELQARPRLDAQSGDSRGRGSEYQRKFSAPERIVREVVSGSIPFMAQTIQELSEEAIESAKEYLKNMISLPERKDEFVSLQTRLERRSDLKKETLSKANKTQLEILVAVKMGLVNFVSGKANVNNTELIEIFLLTRCRNVVCKRVLPIDDCDCKICVMKKGFCSECMCPVCFNFDCANRTCSWVGCDVCSHWCHAACGIQKNLIKPGPSGNGASGTEMQFHCLGCGHASEMFGFVKEVFANFAKDWGLETLKKELECVRKIFRGSEDFKGKELQIKAEEMLAKLENTMISPLDASNFILQFFNYTDGMSEFPPDITSKEATQNQPILRKEAPPPPLPRPISLPSKSTLYNNMSSSSTWHDSVAHDLHRNDLKASLMIDRTVEDELRTGKSSSKQEGFESLESIVRIKEAEAKFFQTRADEARREAEGYRRMARVRTEKLEEEYAEKLAKLCLQETEERRRKKVEELKVLENSQCDYYNMKMRMQAEIAGLLERMEATKKQWV